MFVCLRLNYFEKKPQQECKMKTLYGTNDMSWIDLKLLAKKNVNIHIQNWRLKAWSMALNVTCTPYTCIYSLEIWCQLTFCWCNISTHSLVSMSVFFYETLNLNLFLSLLGMPEVLSASYWRSDHCLISVTGFCFSCLTPTKIFRIVNMFVAKVPRI